MVTIATVTDQAIEIRETSGNIGTYKEDVARVALLRRESAFATYLFSE